MKIVDSHINLYDGNKIPYGHLEEASPVFEAVLGGDYNALPKTYLWSDYQKDILGLDVVGIVWHEFASNDPLKELGWADKHLSEANIAYSLLPAVDLSSDVFAADFEQLQAFSHVTAVRQHLAYHPAVELKRFCAHDHYVSDPIWHKNLKYFANTNIKLGLEVYSNQLSEFIEIIEGNPNIGFTCRINAIAFIAIMSSY
jgi:predicted TIM-barrel fold metal-dependent hydrolase